jgi:hypothetical protein
MLVVRTATMNTPSNVESRSSMARSMTARLGSSAGEVAAAGDAAMERTAAGGLLGLLGPFRVGACLAVAAVMRATLSRAGGRLHRFLGAEVETWWIAGVPTRL